MLIEEWQPFKDYLLDPETVKVLDACQEDLVNHAHLQIVPQNVVDTQLANAYVSENYSLSYAKLVEQNLGLQVDTADALRLVAKTAIG